jgi:hypothetical protein
VIGPFRDSVSYLGNAFNFDVWILLAGKAP